MSESAEFVDLQFSDGTEISGNEKSSILSDNLSEPVKASQDEEDADPDPLVETEMKEEVKL